MMNQTRILDTCAERWLSRITRAYDLGQRHLEAAALLTFYQTALKFQHDVACEDKSKVVPQVPLREQIDLNLALKSMPALLALAIESAPELLSERAKTLKQTNPGEQLRLLEATVSGVMDDQTAFFFARCCLQPLAENLQLQLPDEPALSPDLCPACGGSPQLAILRPEGDGARRSLLCSFCLREWLFRRMICPSCGSEDKEKLLRYKAEGCSHVFVSACDVCKTYVKSVDMTIDGRAIPLVDEVAMAALDVWATEHGYRKITPNLMGF